MARSFNWFSKNGAKCAAIALLMIPTVLPHFLVTRIVNENRTLAPRPKLPTNWAQFLTLPAQTDAWIKDHFGFRTELVEANNRLRFEVFREFPSIRMTAGENGRVFVTAHATAAPPFSAVTEICDVNQGTLKEFGAYLNVLFGSFEKMGHTPKLIIVPSAPVVQSADLPQWLRSRCSSNDTPMAELLKSEYINNKVKAAIWYPLEQMRARNQGTEVFPRTWFHWTGPGLEYIAQDSMKNLFPSMPIVAPRLATRTTVQPSDVSQMFPGIDLPSKVTEPDYGASKIQSCYGTTCFPEFKEFAEPLYDASRFHNPAAPDRRLLILSDSFGSYISGWYSRYYRTVEQVATNNVKMLKQEQVKVLGDFVFREPANTDILFIFHDGSLTGTLRLFLHRFHSQDEGGEEKEVHSPADYNQLAQQLYVSYLGRPADVDGLQSFRRQLAEAGAPIKIQDLNLAYDTNTAVRKLIDGFGESKESNELYAGSNSIYIEAIYQHLFNRQPGTDGLHYWATQIDNGQLTRPRTVLAIAAAALVDKSPQGLLDGALLQKKTNYSTLFTDSLMRARRQCYAGATAARQARAQLATVKMDTDMRQSQIEATRLSDAACE